MSSIVLSVYSCLLLYMSYSIHVHVHVHVIVYTSVYSCLLLYMSYSIHVHVHVHVHVIVYTSVYMYEQSTRIFERKSFYEFHFSLYLCTSRSFVA